MRKPRLVLVLVTGAVTVAGASLALPAHAGGRSGSPRPAAPQTASKAATPAVEISTSTEPVCPDYGFQKIRIGTQIADGSYVPDGTTTLGSTLTITQTDMVPADCEEDLATQVKALAAAHGVKPGAVRQPRAGESETTTCTTTVARAATARRPHAGSSGAATETDCTQADDETMGFFASGSYIVFPGDAVTVTQNKPANPGLVVDPTTITFQPCVSDSEVCNSTAAITNDRGLAPVAANDSATVKTGDAADILVLSNDQSSGAPTDIDSTTTPSDGTATIEGSPAVSFDGRHANAANGGQSIVYKPKAGFVGHDSFRYTIRDANGTSTATVSVTVTAPPPTAANDTSTTASGTAVTIPVTTNDNANGGGKLTITAVGDPAHGTAKIDGQDILYTPNAGFSGTDSFPYTVATAFGTATATVTVTVPAAVVVPAPVPTVPTSATLPFTGLDAGMLGLTAGGLLLGGAGARVLARRRPLTRRQRRARHGRS